MKKKKKKFYRRTEPLNKRISNLFFKNEKYVRSTQLFRSISWITSSYNEVFQTIKVAVNIPGNDFKDSDN